ncbi:conserved hypothetical protein [Mycoplasma leachii PG50]|uniref:YitH acetyltransferase (GNAT) domain-containing protein n=1 Tax=Mycoplasma leachii (strain DSM 21131 / NCTC 10133 / N29 / PG50) TaxID=880447 RepID=E4PTG9_MYCLG|nr:hypothetical protein [Mycoplasma leachii]ADR24270.1 conserved hypothetical protein [Mycoplasma leachii PG50]
MNSHSLVFNYRDNKHFLQEMHTIIKKRGSKTFEEWMINNNFDSAYVPVTIVNERNGVLAVSGFIKSKAIINKTTLNTILLTNTFTKSKESNPLMVDELIKGVVKKYENISDFIYTFSNVENDDVLIRNGFKKIKEYTYFMQWDPNKDAKLSVLKRLDLDTNQVDFEFVKDELFHSSKNNSLFYIREDGALSIYSLLKYYRNNVFYISNLDAIVIFSINNKTFQLIGLYSKNEIDVLELLESIVPKGILLIEFYFVPNIKNKFVVKELRKIMAADYQHRSFLYVKQSTTNLEASKFVVPLLNRLK